MSGLKRMERLRGSAGPCTKCDDAGLFLVKGRNPIFIAAPGVKMTATWKRKEKYSSLFGRCKFHRGTFFCILFIKQLAIFAGLCAYLCAAAAIQAGVPQIQTSFKTWQFTWWKFGIHMTETEGKFWRNPGWTANISSGVKCVTLPRNNNNKKKASWHFQRRSCTQTWKESTYGPLHTNPSERRAHINAKILSHLNERRKKSKTPWERRRDNKVVIWRCLLCVFVKIIVPPRTTCCRPPEGSPRSWATNLWPIPPLQVDTDPLPGHAIHHTCKRTHRK